MWPDPPLLEVSLNRYAQRIVGAPNPVATYFQEIEFGDAWSG